MKKVFTSASLTEILRLPQEQTHHILHVLRHPKERLLTIAHPMEGSAPYRLLQAEADGTSLWQLAGEITPHKLKPPVILVQAFLKSDKLEWVLQKTAELDVTTVYGVATKNAVAKYDVRKLRAKEERWRKIQQEASQQCGRDTIPSYNSFPSWETLLAELDSQYPNSLRLLAYENETSHHIKTPLRHHFGGVAQPDPVIVAIGPEGGFDDSEVARLMEVNFQTVTLGDTILRAETAAITAVALITYERG